MGASVALTYGNRLGGRVSMRIAGGDYGDGWYADSLGGSVSPLRGLGFFVVVPSACALG